MTAIHPNMRILTCRSPRKARTHPRTARRRPPWSSRQAGMLSERNPTHRGLEVINVSLISLSSEVTAASGKHAAANSNP